MVMPQKSPESGKFWWEKYKQQYASQSPSNDGPVPAESEVWTESELAELMDLRDRFGETQDIDELPIEDKFLRRLTFVKWLVETGRLDV